MKHLKTFNNHFNEDIHESNCPMIENPLAPEIEFKTCIPAVTFDDEMKYFIKETKKLSSKLGQAYTLKNFLEKWLKEYRLDCERITKVNSRYYSK